MTFDEMFGSKRKIYSHGCKNFLGEYEDCFGDLNQGNTLGELFNDPDFNYYQTHIRFQGDDVKDSIGNAESSTYNWVYSGVWNSWPQTQNTTLNHRTELAWQKFPCIWSTYIKSSRKICYLFKISSNSR